MLQAIANVIDHGMVTVEAPRVWSQDQAPEVEDGVAAPARDRLAALGHDARVVARVAGGMEGVISDAAAGLNQSLFTAER